MPDIAGEIVDDVGDADLHRCPFDANGAYEEPHLCFLTGEDMFDECADFRPSAIGP